MSSNTGEYHGTADIPFPAVPPAVLKREKVRDQAAEMKKWFRAWRDGNTTERDYRPYFKYVHMVPNVHRNREAYKGRGEGGKGVWRCK